MGIPKNWDKNAHIEWAEGRRTEAIRLLIDTININPMPLPEHYAVQLAYYLALDGKWRDAASVLAKVCDVYPDESEARLNLGICLARSGDLNKAINVLKEVLHNDPDLPAAWDSLASAYYKSGLYTEAQNAGERSLILKNTASENLIPEWSPPAVSPSEFVSTGNKKNIISFSLWGDDPRYLRGAVQNAMSVSDIYPGWRCRFYVDGSVPADVLSVLDELGVELVYEHESSNINGRVRLARRFWVANDNTVGYFAVRDCDSVISHREAAAVNAWIASDRWFHVMRDWWTHTELILAGMWGGVAGILPDLKQLFEGYSSKQLETPNWDQWFLRDRIWGMIKNHCLIHDRFFRVLDSLPFPVASPGGNVHIGQDEFAVRRIEQEKILSEWADRCPSLRIKVNDETGPNYLTQSESLNSNCNEKAKWNKLAECRYGKMIYNCNDKYIGRSFELYGEYSEGEAVLFRQIVKEGHTVVEVGSNIGAHTLLLAKLAGAKGRIYALEPQRLVYQLLAGNMAINSINNVYCIQKAVGNAAGTLLVPVLDCELENNWGGLSLGNWQYGERVDVITLDSLELSECHFLKIDAEGMELQVLQGAADLIARLHPILYVENDRKDKSAELISYIDSLGYELYWHRPPLYNPDNYSGNKKNVFGSIVSINMLCVHKSITSKITNLQKINVTAGIN